MRAPGKWVLGGRPDDSLLDKLGDLFSEFPNPDFTTGLLKHDQSRFLVRCGRKSARAYRDLGEPVLLKTEPLEYCKEADIFCAARLRLGSQI